MAVVGVLPQVQNGTKRVNAYKSRLLDKSEKIYCTTDNELLPLLAFYRVYQTIPGFYFDVDLQFELTIKHLFAY